MKTRIVESYNGDKYLTSKIADSKLLSSGAGTVTLPTKFDVTQVELNVWKEVFAETHIDEQGNKLEITCIKLTRNNELYSERRFFEESVSDNYIKSLKSADYAMQ
jgi:hypothetical protein